MFKPKNKIVRQEPVEVEEVLDNEEVVETPAPAPIQTQSVKVEPKKLQLVDSYTIGEIPTQTAMVIVNNRTKETLDVYGALARILNILSKFEREFDKEQ